MPRIRFVSHAIPAPSSSSPLWSSSDQSGANQRRATLDQLESPFSVVVKDGVQYFVNSGRTPLGRGVGAAEFLNADRNTLTLFIMVKGRKATEIGIRGAVRNDVGFT